MNNQYPAGMLGGALSQLGGQQDWMQRQQLDQLYQQQAMARQLMQVGAQPEYNPVLLLLEGD